MNGMGIVSELRREKSQTAKEKESERNERNEGRSRICLQ